MKLQVHTFEKSRAIVLFANFAHILRYYLSKIICTRKNNICTRKNHVLNEKPVLSFRSQCCHLCM